MQDKEQWITNILESMQDSERATPNADLFSKIEAQIDVPQVRVISLRRWQLAAAIFLLLIVNAFTLYHSAQPNFSVGNTELASEDGNKQQLLSNYKIYE